MTRCAYFILHGVLLGDFDRLARLGGGSADGPSPAKDPAMLPFHKRSRMSNASGSIEIDSDDLEAVEIPSVRPPSVRPGGYAPRHSLASFDDEMTVVRVDKRVSTSPPPRAAYQMPRIPQSYAPNFDEYDRQAAAAERRRRADEEPTLLHPNSTSQRPLLSMNGPRSVIVDQEPPRSRRVMQHEVPPPPPSRAMVDEAPRSARAVDASSSSAHVRAVDMSMTSSSSGSTDVSKLRRPSMGWAAGLVVVGVFAGLIAAVVARGDGLSAVASLVDPSHVTADVAKAAAVQPQVGAAMPGAVAMPGAAAPQQTEQASAKPAAPSCNADAVAPVKAVAKVEAPAPKQVVVVKADAAPAVAYAAPVVHHEAPAPVVHHEAAPVVHHDAPVAAAAPITHPAAPVVHASRHHGDEMESANAADALAKAQLDAALSR